MNTGSETLHVSLSGLDSAEMCWVKRLVRALGESLAKGIGEPRSDSFQCRRCELPSHCI